MVKYGKVDNEIAQMLRASRVYRVQTDWLIGAKSEIVRRNKKQVNHKVGALHERTSFDLVVCECSTPPWDHCEHTTINKE